MPVPWHAVPSLHSIHLVLYRSAVPSLAKRSSLEVKARAPRASISHDFLEAFNVVDRKKPAAVTTRSQSVLYCGHRGTTVLDGTFLRLAFLPSSTPLSTPPSLSILLRTYSRIRHEHCRHVAAMRCDGNCGLADNSEMILLQAACRRRYIPATPKASCEWSAFRFRPRPRPRLNKHGIKVLC